jgi:hypothetical protein
MPTAMPAPPPLSSSTVCSKFEIGVPATRAVTVGRSV